eukprot:3212703-Lingulodinium_polyedra.AAC.1
MKSSRLIVGKRFFSVAGRWKSSGLRPSATAMDLCPDLSTRNGLMVTASPSRNMISLLARSMRAPNK